MGKMTVTIAIPAFNEEVNIETFLLSIFKQDLEKIDLKEILVYSDASSDKTDEIVENLSKKYPLLKLIKGKERKGKYFRVNEFFKLSNSDVLVVLDADIAFADHTVLETLVQSLIKDKDAAMMAAHIELIRPNGFLPKLIHTTFVLGDFMRLSVPGYDIASNFHGAATAYKRSFIKSVSIPSNLSDPHIYIYLSAKKINGFRYCPNAKIFQVPPTTMNDVANVMKRSIGKRDPELEKIFGKEMIQNVNIITRKAKIMGVIKCFLRYPFYTPLAIFMVFYFRKFASQQKTDTSPIWEINTTTKKKIAYEN